MSFACCLNEIHCKEMGGLSRLHDGKILLAFCQRLLAIKAEILKVGLTIREHIALDNPGISQARGLTTSRARDVCFRYGSSSGTKNIFLHDRHLSFY